MFITGHYIDSNCNIQNTVLNSVQLPPLRRGTNIEDDIHKCLKERGI